MRRMGLFRRHRALSHGEGRQAHEDPIALATVRLDGLERDRRVHDTRGHVHRRGRHVAEGCARHRAEVRRGHRGHAAVSHRHEDAHRQRKRVLRGRRATEDCLVFQSSTESDSVEIVAGFERTDPRRARRRRDVGKRRRDGRQHRRLHAQHGSWRSRHHDRRLPRLRAFHRAQQLGNRLGRQRIRIRDACVHRGGLLRRIVPASPFRDLRLSWQMADRTWQRVPSPSAFSP